MNAAARCKLLEQAADRILAADNDNKPPEPPVRFRGTRPAWSWLAKHDALGAACLWLVARQRLPQAANDNHAEDGLRLDRRKDGKARGKNAAPRNLEAYLELPAVRPRLGDAGPVARALKGWDGESCGVTIKAQTVDYPLHDDCRFGFGPPVIAYGAFFLGAQGGLGRPRPHTSRGDVRRVEEPDAAVLPAEVDIVIEAILARATVAGVGEALGAHGGYADRRGRKALMDAARWAKTASPMQQQA